MLSADPTHAATPVGARNAPRSEPTPAAPHEAIAPDATRTLSLDSLALERGRDLGERYRRGRVPPSLEVLSGRPKGRMLAVRSAESARLFERLRTFAGARAFPWGGKSFFRVEATHGRGINRVRLGRVRFDAFPFDTRVEASVVDGRPTILLDYDKAENPFFIRRIRDEIREIEAGLYLGPAMWRDDAGGAAHVLWFALDFRDQEGDR